MGSLVWPKSPAALPKTQPLLSQGTAWPIMTIFDVSPTFEIEASDGDAEGLVLIDVNFCRRCDGFSLCQRSRSLTGLFSFLENQL